MRRALVLAAVLPLAACGGRTPQSVTTPTPAARPAAPAEPRALQYGANVGRYRIEAQTHIVQEMMGQSQDRNTSLSVDFTTALTPEAGNLAAAITIDSIAVDAATQAAGDIQSARGRTYHAVYTPAGRSVSLTGPDTTNVVVVQMGELFREFLPALPPAPIAAGMTWTDTVTSSTSPVPGLVMRSQSVRQHRVVGWEDHGGVRALHISTSGTYTITGEGEQSGQQLQLSGAGATTLERFISAAGVYLGQTGSDSTNLTVNVLSAGMEIPIRQTRHSTVTRLP